MIDKNMETPESRRKYWIGSLCAVMPGESLDYALQDLEQAFLAGILSERNRINTELAQMTQTNQIKDQTK